MAPRGRMDAGMDEHDKKLIAIIKPDMKLWRCSRCNRVLMELDVKRGTIRKVCERCKTINTLEITPG